MGRFSGRWAVWTVPTSPRLKIAFTYHTGARRDDRGLDAGSNMDGRDRYAA